MLKDKIEINKLKKRPQKKSIHVTFETIDSGYELGTNSIATK